MISWLISIGLALLLIVCIILFVTWIDALTRGQDWAIFIAFIVVIIGFVAVGIHRMLF